jgi:hypothetical protein
VKEFLLTIDPTKESEFSKYRIGIEEDQIPLVRTFLTFLNLKDFEINPPENSAAYDMLAERYAFLRYAVRYWASHAESHFVDEYIEKSAHLLFTPSKTKQFVLWTQCYLHQVFLDDLEDAEECQVPSFLNSGSTHWAARLGLDKLCGWLLAQDSDVNKPSCLGTPLNCAFNGGDVFLQTS